MPGVSTTLFAKIAQNKKHWGQLYGSARGLAVAEAAMHGDSMVLLTTGSTREAFALAQEVRFYLAGSGLPVLSFPDWETLPYDQFSPHPDIVAERLTTLHQLPAITQGVLIAPIATLMQRVLPRAYLDAHVLMLQRGERFDLDTFRTKLIHSGYRHVSQVMEHGEFAIRGALLDLFPPGSDTPFRIDLFDDEIESLRTFDPSNQRTLDQVERIELLPAREYPLNEAGIGLFRQQFRESFDSKSRHSPLYRDVSNGLAPAGIEYYLPLFFERVETLFEYLPASLQCLNLAGIENAADEFHQHLGERYEQRRHDIERPLLEPTALYMRVTDMMEQLQARGAVEVSAAKGVEQSDTASHGTALPPPLTVNPRASDPLQALRDFHLSLDGKILFVAESAGRREVLLDLLHGNRIRPRTVAGWQEFLAVDDPLQVTVGALDEGCVLPQAGIAVIAEGQLFGERARQERRRQPTRDADAVIANLSELRDGAPVVHIDHGVGRYRGMTTLDIGAVNAEFLAIEYAGGDKLYVPVLALHLVSRYTGTDPEHAPLHRLGGEQWQKIKRRAAQKARDVAVELLEVNARRAARRGEALSFDEVSYAAFRNGFPFDETPDQGQAIDATVNDLREPRPMDRVVCGDVGFGKTEVAMRAAFVAVEAGKQVCLLVPTTLLAQQHYENFHDRFADWPVRVEALSRFQSTKQQNAIMHGLADGTVDIVIGTHKLLQKAVRFDRLGLVIIDEEHRFGVRHKEHMKSLRAEVDLLTLTATPIPRTLNMSLAGLRDLSIIATAPPHRHSIKTFVAEWDIPLIKEAIQRELARGGQVYFVHNEVKSIERIAREVQEAIPEATVRFAHGQMPERELEHVMLDFYHQRFNVLVCTTIIESGIDVPTANTILINRADKLGMAQLHQLRGRVGRSHHRAYAYLFSPPAKLISADAQRRLEAIESLEDLGVGFTLATHDMEIRGAGELLGEEQSGQIQQVGFTLYSELLARAVQAIKTGVVMDEDLDPAATEIELRLPTLIPDDYVPDVHLRLILYKRIAGAEDAGQLNELKVELIDRFGMLPQASLNLLRTTHLKLRAQALGIKRLEAMPDGGRVVFVPEPALDAGAVISLVQSESDTYRFSGADTLRFDAELAEDDARFEFVEGLLTRFEACIQTPESMAV